MAKPSKMQLRLNKSKELRVVENRQREAEQARQVAYAEAVAVSDTVKQIVDDQFGNEDQTPRHASSKAKPKRTIFMGREEAGLFNYGPNDVVISINDCGQEAPTFLRSNPKEVLILNFEDSAPYHGYSADSGKRQVMVEDGEKIANFVWKNITADTIVIHCRYGQSRSKAVAVIVHEYTNRELLHIDASGRTKPFVDHESDRGNGRVRDCVRFGFEELG